MSKRNLGLMLLVLSGSVGLAACGSAQPQVQPTAAPAAEGSTAPTAAAASDAAGSAAGPVALDVKTLDTFVFEPNAWTTTAGAKTTINMDNSAGTQEHTWVVLNKGVTVDQAKTVTDADTDKILFAARTPAGQKASETFTAPADKGNYVVVCTVAGHAAGGMLGSLTVN